MTITVDIDEPLGRTRNITIYTGKYTFCLKVIYPMEKSSITLTTIK